ncbi:hypothetical protein GIB67_039666 [Kingdonia uniflora]|uniref:Probable magnesium transporter n=1 Tax=Kingdonia uniflora TaxID=39325 RepID=A0A7J7LS80_9MAGN|nr:hypothetical protein GIB67_039666 [Kingdonia uniflora]
MVTVKVLVATAFIVLGNIFSCCFWQPPVPGYRCPNTLYYTSQIIIEIPESISFHTRALAEKYENFVFLFYCVILILIVVASLHLQFSGAVGSCSVLFAKSLSNLLRLTMSSSYQLHSWFTYSMFLLFLVQLDFGGKEMARLNEGLALFDAILIVPMFQMLGPFLYLHRICLLPEYQVFDALRKQCSYWGWHLWRWQRFFFFYHFHKHTIDGDSVSTCLMVQLSKSASEMAESDGTRSFWQAMVTRVSSIIVKAKTACTLSLGLGEDSISASSVFVMPMVSSRMTGFRGTNINRAKLFSFRNPGWSKISIDEDDEMFETSSMLPQTRG